MYLEVSATCLKCREGTLDLQASVARYMDGEPIVSAPLSWQQSCYCQLTDEDVLDACGAALEQAFAEAQP